MSALCRECLRFGTTRQIFFFSRETGDDKLVAIPDVCQSTFQDDPCIRIGAKRLYGMTKDTKWAHNILAYASERKRATDSEF